MIKNDGQLGFEYLNTEQLEYLFRCRHKDAHLPQVVQSSDNQISIDGERAISHLFVNKQIASDIAKGNLQREDVPAIPQSVELVNQTVSVPKEPVKDTFVWRQIFEYRNLGQNPQLR
jgi:hypothetical protein